MVVIKKTISTLAIFLVVPIAIIAINWQWHPEALNNASQYFFWVTESAGFPWAMISSIFLFFIFVFCLKIKSKTRGIKLLLILMFALFSGQVIKSAIKSYVGESRPFVLWLEKAYQVDDEFFYSLPRSERKVLIEKHIYESPQIPNWLYEHWRNETGYAFPSGHTLFATTWAFLALVLLRLRKYHFLIATIVTWAILIEISRLSLGMHHPLDLILGAFLAWIIAMISYFFAMKWDLIEP